MSTFPPLNEKQRDIFEPNGVLRVRHGGREERESWKKIYRKARGRENRRNYSETTDVCVTACLAKSISEWYAWILYRLVSAQSSDSLNLNAKYCISIRLSRKWDSIFCPSVFRDRVIQNAASNDGRFPVEVLEFRILFQPSSFDNENRVTEIHWSEGRNFLQENFQDWSYFQSFRWILFLLEVLNASEYTHTPVMEIG